MKKYILLISIIFLLIYYIITLLISITFLNKSVVNNDSIFLEKYINVKELRNNIYDDIHEYSLSLINLIDKNIKIENESIKFTGELTSSFLEKLFSKIASSISTDFSNSEIMLYFYFNSNELSEYLNKSFNNFGNYNFQKFLTGKKSVNKNNNYKNIDESEKTDNEIINIKNINFISNLIKKYKSTDYFFLTSPIHFKIKVKHQDIPFIVILKFNGYMWKVQKITIPFNILIDPKKISLIN